MLFRSLDFHTCLDSWFQWLEVHSTVCRQSGNHGMPCIWRCPQESSILQTFYAPPSILVTLTMNAFDSGIMVLGSPTFGVSKFTLSPPFLGTIHPKHHGMPTWCTVTSPILNGLNRVVTMATASSSPRTDETLTFSPKIVHQLSPLPVEARPSPKRSR